MLLRQTGARLGGLLTGLISPPWTTCCLSSSMDGKFSECPVLTVDGTRTPLASYVREGPLFHDCCGDTGASFDAWEWAARGSEVEKILDLNSEGGLSSAQASRVYHYYLPVFDWVLHRFRDHVASSSNDGHGKPLFIGLSCPQGGGKTTIVDTLQIMLERELLSCAALSLDDFYRTHEDQLRLASQFKGNRLLELRGNPGTHDMGLALGTLEAMRSKTSGDVQLPRYDKSKFGGRGDRSPPECWNSVRAPVDVVLLEGWCLGFGASEDKATLADPMLKEVNEFLKRGGYEEMHAMMDAWIVVRIPTPQLVYQWREEAEEAMRSAGKPAMNPEEVEDFVSRYMASYIQYLPDLYNREPMQVRDEIAEDMRHHSTSSPAWLEICIDEHRNPTSRLN